MNPNATMEQMKALKLQGMARHYEQLLQQPIDQWPDAHEMIALLVEHEFQNRNLRRTKMFLRLSKMRYPAQLEQIKCSANRNLSKPQLMKLSDCSYIDRAENVLITGATGCGKSFLACALGNHACALNRRTLYFNMNRFCEQLLVAKADGTFIKWINRIQKAKLIILDDFGLQTMTHPVKLALLQILEDRYERAATIISSQLPVSKWHDFIQEPTLADAIMDRLLARAHRIELKGKSWRKPTIKAKS